jgi:hypothetical protein
MYPCAKLHGVTSHKTVIFNLPALSPPNKLAFLLLILIDIDLTSILIHFCSPSKFSSRNKIFKYVKIMKRNMKRQDSEVRNIIEVQKSGKLCDHVGIMGMEDLSESVVSPGLFCCPMSSPRGCETLIFFCGKV